MVNPVTGIADTVRVNEDPSAQPPPPLQWPPRAGYTAEYTVAAVRAIEIFNGPFSARVEEYMRLLRRVHRSNPGRPLRYWNYRLILEQLLPYGPGGALPPAAWALAWHIVRLLTLDPDDPAVI